MLGGNSSSSRGIVAERAGVAIFLHIPKTGGTSFRQVVETVYGSRCISVYSLDAATLAGVKEQLVEADALFGHLFYGIHQVLGIAPRYITIVRDPVERVISFYRHQARDEDSEFFGAIADGMTLRDLLESGRCHQVNNHMVRIVSGYESSEPIHDEHVLRRALANLNQFECLGVTARMDESVLQIARRLGWRSVPAVPRINTSPSRDFSIDSATRDAILRQNALDLQLYDAVASSFDRESCVQRLTS
jgi:hypothetical protein